MPCNNDLLAGNFVEDDRQVWLIDYEYSGNNDACFELGNTSTECDLDDDQVAALVEAYAGSLDAAMLARVRLQALVLGVRLGAVGRDPVRGQRDRLRLRRLEPRALREGGAAGSPRTATPRLLREVAGG